MDSKEIRNGTFIIQVKYTEKETWQGKVTWAEKNKSQYFRSALEMLKLMDKALTEEDFPDEEEEE